MPNLLMLDGPVDNVLGPLQHLVVLAGLVTPELTLILKPCTINLNKNGSK